MNISDDGPTPDESNTIETGDTDCMTADDVNDLLLLREWYRDILAGREWVMEPERGIDLTRDAARKLIPVLQAFVAKEPT